MIGLTAKQLAVLRFIEGFWQANYRAPTHRELSAGMGHRVGGWTFHSFDTLTERGRLDASLRPVSPPPVPRAPDGAPLYFVRVLQRAEG